MIKSCFFFLFLFFTSIVSAQDSYNPKIDEYEIDSKVFNEKRFVSVSTPVGYVASNKNATYLVAYLFDGQFVPYFNMVNATTQYYSQVGDGVPMIVISIHTKQRSVEFTPKPLHEETSKGWDGYCGEAEKLTQFIREEVIPQIESKYNTKPYRLAIGHSLGGTYVITELMKKESLFNGVIAVSPNMQYDKEQLVQQGKDYFKNFPNSKAFVYSAAGDVGNMENNFRKSLEKLDEHAKTNVPKGMTWNYEYMPGDTHMSTFLPAFDNGYLAFSEKWIMTEKQSDDIANAEEPIVEFEKFYANIASFAGFDYQPNNDDYNNFAYTLDYFKKQDKALVVLDKAISLFPKDANLHDSKGEMLEKLGDEKAAHASYKKALSVLEINKTDYDKESYEYYFEMISKNATRTKAK